MSAVSTSLTRTQLSQAEAKFRHGEKKYGFKKRRYPEKPTKPTGHSMVSCEYRDIGQGYLERRDWTERELKEMWRLRYEKKPKHTYEQLRKKYKLRDTQYIVDILCLMRGREQAGQYKFTPIIHQ